LRFHSRIEGPEFPFPFLEEALEGISRTGRRFLNWASFADNGWTDTINLDSQL
jgi:hypothetical protein